MTASGCCSFTLLCWRSLRRRNLDGQSATSSLGESQYRHYYSLPHSHSVLISKSVALSMKMNFLLYLPALLYLSFTTLSPIDSVLHLLLTSLTLVIISFPFISTSEHALTYFHTSFDFSRKFLWQWTVNWRWIGQETFESEGFGNALLIAHVVGLALFVIKWSEGDAGGLESMLRRAVRYPSKPAGLVENSPDRLSFLPLCSQIFHAQSGLRFSGFLTIVFSANLLGITFARSLHYQFYAWYAHQLVFLVLHTPYDLLQQCAFFRCTV